MSLGHKKSFLMSEVGVNLKNGLCTQNSNEMVMLAHIIKDITTTVLLFS